MSFLPLNLSMGLDKKIRIGALWKQPFRNMKDLKLSITFKLQQKILQTLKDQYQYAKGAPRTPKPKQIY